VSEQKDTRWKVEISHNISIYDMHSIHKDTVCHSTYEYGVLETKAFKDLLTKMEKHGGLTKEYHFSPSSILSSNLSFTEDYLQRSYESSIVSMINATKKRNGVIEAPTGSGKTNIMCSLIVSKNLKTLIVVPSTSLAYQTKKRLMSVSNLDYSEIGLCADDKKELSTNLVVATWQSLQNEKTFTTILELGFNMLLVDEAHRASASVLNGIITSIPAEYKFGFSATVYRTHKEQLQDIYKALGGKIATISIDFLYKEKYLVKPSIYLYNTGVSLSLDYGLSYYFANKLIGNEKMRWVFVNKLFKDKSYKMLAPENKTMKQIVMAPTKEEILLLARIAKDEYKAGQEKEIPFANQIGLAKTGLDLYPPRMKKSISRAKNKLSMSKERAFVLFNTVEAGRHFAEEMFLAGYKNIFVVNGQTDNSYSILSDIASKDIDNYIVVTTVQFLGEGSDVPSLSNIIVGSPVYPPFSDMARLQQIIGRGMRPDPYFPNKKCNVHVSDDNNIDWTAGKKQEAYSIVDTLVKPRWINESKKIILLSGELRSGKDTVAEMASEFLSANNITSSFVAFADPIKNIASKSLNISVNELNNYKNGSQFELKSSGKFVSILKNGKSIKDLNKQDVLNNFLLSSKSEIGDISSIDKKLAVEILKIIFPHEDSSINFRTYIQRLGFDGILKNTIDTIWIDKAIDSISLKQEDVVFVTDARTIAEPKEIKKAFKNSTIIKVERSSKTKVSSHATEAEVSQIKEDILIKNDKDLPHLQNIVSSYCEDIFSGEVKKREITDKFIQPNDVSLFDEEEESEKLGIF